MTIALIIYIIVAVACFAGLSWAKRAYCKTCSGPCEHAGTGATLTVSILWPVFVVWIVGRRVAERSDQ